MTEQIRKFTGGEARRAGLVFLWFFLSLMVFYSGHLYSNDAYAKIMAARNLVLHGDPHLDPDPRVWGKVGREGKMYANFPIGQILLMVPAVVVVNTVSEVFHALHLDHLQSFLVSAQNLIWTAVSGTLLFVFTLAAGAKPRNAFYFSNLCIFATVFLPYSSGGWSEPAAFAFCTFGIFWLLEGNGDLRTAVISFVCAGLSVLIRMEYIVFVFAVVVLVQIFDRKPWGCVFVFGVGVLFFFSLNLLYNHFRFGDLLDFGYHMGGNRLAPESGSIRRIAGEFINWGRLKAFYFFYISFGRHHFFWVSPLLLLVPLWVWENKKLPSSVRVLLFSAIAFIPFVGLNSWCWANRYIYGVVPFLILPLAFTYDRSSVRRNAIRFLAACGIVVSTLATVVNYHIVLAETVNQMGESEAFWGKGATIMNAPIWRHAEMLPKMVFKTVHYALECGTNTVSWSVARETFLDIWPVGLAVVGVPPCVAFAFWLCMVVLTLVWGRWVFGQIGKMHV